jgi:hypothetical protein
MTTVTKKISRLLKQKNRGILSSASAMLGIYKDLRKQSIDEIKSVEDDSYAAYHLKQNRIMLEKAIADAESAAKTAMNDNINNMWEAGEAFVAETLAAGEISISGQPYLLNRSLLESLKDFASTRLDSLTEAAWNKINAELSLGVLGQKTPYEVSKAIAGTIKNPGIYRNVFTRATTITEVEMGRIFSTATMESLKNAQESVPGLMKEWIHAGHPKKPRASHLSLHGQKKKVDEPFVIGSLVIDYPRDPKAPLEEVIHCGCEVIPWHPDWGDSAEIALAA